MTTITKLKRIFVIEEKGKKLNLPDIDPKMSIEDIKKHYSNMYPSLINARGHETKIDGDSQIITFTTTFAPKG